MWLAWTGRGVHRFGFPLLLLRMISEKEHTASHDGEVGWLPKSPACCTDKSTPEADLRESASGSSLINSLSLAPTELVAGKTTLVQEAYESVTALGKHLAPVSDVITPPDLQNLTDYFSRPKIISSGAIATTRTRLVTIDQTVSGFLDLLTGGRTRMAGAFGVRFDLVFRLQVATTPFHQGVLALSFEYFNGARWARSERSSTCTNLPHVRLDVSSATMCELRVPFVSPVDFTLINSTTKYGIAAVNAISPVVAVAGLATPTYKLYLSAENVSFYGVSPMAISTLTPTMLLPSGDLPVEQGGQIEAEFDFVNKPASSAVTALSLTLGNIAKYVPSLASIAGPASWFTGKAAGVLRYFGFARPLLTAPPQRMTAPGHLFEHNVDMPSAATILAPYSDNRLTITPEFSRTDVDEMSLAFVLSQWCQLKHGIIFSTSVSGQVRWACNLSPSFMWFKDQDTSVSSSMYSSQLPSTLAINTAGFQPTGLAYFASMFRYWRGGFKFRFTFAKTKMHAGRVMVCFVPQVDYSNAATFFLPEVDAVAVQPNCMAKVFDLKDNNVFEFEVPYTSYKPWTKFQDHFGTISMSILDPLVAPSMVSSSVYWFVEVCAMDGFELAVPTGPLYPPIDSGTVVEQSGELIPTYKSNVCELTIGESINSLKQLIMLPKLTSTKLSAATAMVSTLAPWYYQPKQTFTANSPDIVPESLSYGGVISRCYAYVRGGSEYHVYHSQDSNTTGCSAILRPSDGYGVLGGTGNLSSLLYTASHDGAMHFRTPAYQPYVRIPSGALNSINKWSPCLSDLQAGATRTFTFTNAELRTSPWLPSVLPELNCVYSDTAGSAGFVIKRMASDEAMCGLYMGPPPCTINVPDHDYLPVVAVSALV